MCMKKEDIDDFIESVEIDNVDELLETDVEPSEYEIVSNNHEIIKYEDIPDNVISDKKNDLEKDYNFSRQNLHKVMELSQDALQDSLDFAKSSGSPKAYEAVAKLVRTIMDSSEKLLIIHEKMGEMENSQSKHSQNAGTINNFVFNGTTDELQEIIDGKKKKEG